MFNLFSNSTFFNTSGFTLTALSCIIDLYVSEALINIGNNGSVAFNRLLLVYVDNNLVPSKLSRGVILVF